MADMMMAAIGGQGLRRKYKSRYFLDSTLTNIFIIPLAQQDLVYIADFSSMSCPHSHRQHCSDRTSSRPPYMMHLPRAITACISLLCIGAQAIVSGDVSSQNPYIVSVTSRGLLGDSHICGGTMIGPKTILTAAHCVEEQRASNLKAKYGGTDRSQLAHSNLVSRIIIHPDWNPLTFNPDFAILHLTSALLDSSGTDQTVFAPLGKQRPPVGTEVDVSGWGKTSNLALTLPRELRNVALRVLETEACSQKWSGLYDIEKSMVCAESDDGTACSGDDGGPVMDLERSVVYGVLSTFASYCRADNTERPPIYADVAAVLRWIEQNIV